MHKYTEKNIFFDIFWQKGKNKIYHYFKKKSNLKMLSLYIHYFNINTRIRNGKTTKFFGPAHSSLSRSGPARNTIFNFRPVWPIWGPAKIC